MFVDAGDAGLTSENDQLDLSNAIPGHLIAYEDIENDLLLAGDLNWKYTLLLPSSVSSCCKHFSLMILIIHRKTGEGKEKKNYLLRL